MSDILGARGFLNKRKLEVIKKLGKRVKARKIDLIFVNFAPTVTQVARQRIPVINELIGIHPYLFKEMPRFLNRGKNKGRSIDILVKVFGQNRVPDTLTKALHGDLTYILNEPEFDNFHPRNAKPRAIGITGSQRLLKQQNFPSQKKYLLIFIHIGGSP